MTNSNSGAYDPEPYIYCFLFCEEDTTEPSHRWDQKTKAIDVAWILGYRTSPKKLFFGGPFVQFLQADINSTLNILDHKDDGISMGGNIAFEYRFYSGFGFTSEVVFYANDWEYTDDTGMSFNAKFDYQF